MSSRRDTPYIREHVMPISVSMRKAKEFLETDFTRGALREFLLEHCVMCIISLDEELLVDQHKKTMPDEDNLWSRYEAVGVKPIGEAKEFIVDFKAPGGGNSTHTKFKKSSLDEVVDILYVNAILGVNPEWLIDAVFSGMMFIPETRWYVTEDGLEQFLNRHPRAKRVS